MKRKTKKDIREEIETTSFVGISIGFALMVLEISFYFENPVEIVYPLLAIVAIIMIRVIYLKIKIRRMPE